MGHLQVPHGHYHCRGAGAGGGADADADVGGGGDGGRGHVWVGCGDHLSLPLKPGDPTLCLDPVGGCVICTCDTCLHLALCTQIRRMRACLLVWLCHLYI